MTHAKDNPRKGCDFCKNLAVSECDAWDKAFKQACRKLVCHKCRHRVSGIDCCPKHSRSKAVVTTKAGRAKQTSIFEILTTSEFRLTGRDSLCPAGASFVSTMPPSPSGGRGEAGCDD